ncbi:MAG: hypothetical protein QF632_04510 [Candidatus Woesearchaeota archaeon]|jgi:hypothetical protein|nr:hypothetical protein [Candidatus Woesearchaeota archaeon]|tara:strand:- start:67 stop:237 length:171 start_codon:yes stop_codon:yes gene_type:complete
MEEEPEELEDLLIEAMARINKREEADKIKRNQFARTMKDVSEEKDCPYMPLYGSGD